MAATPATGSKAPDIQLPDQDGALQKLADQRGKWVLVYFYPRDDTPGCTVEACGVRDAWKEFRAHGIQVFGISADSVKRHKKFADKFELPFTLLADEEKRVIRAFGAWGKKKFMGREFDGILRQSFLIDPSGKIAKVYPKVKPAEHAAEVLEDVLALSGGGSRIPRKVPSKRAPAKAKPAAAKTKKKTVRRAAKPAKRN
jgi:peroxiredoxin Q/BCP